MGCDIFQKLRNISKIAEYAFEMMMTIDLILQRGLSESSRSPVSVLQVEALWLPQVLNQGLSHQCTCFSHVRAGALT